MRYNAIVIGGGHNGLTAAAYLARAGRKVLVLERRHILGGAAVTEEVFPGFKFSVCSYVVSLLRPEIIRDLDLPQVVVDPVLIAKGGDRLLAEEAIATIRLELLPLAHVVTPNIPEAEALTGSSIHSLEDMRDAAMRILRLGPRVVLVKGGHAGGAESIDVCVTAAGSFDIRRPRIDTPHTHGTGCTLASAIAANLALGLPEREAIELAREYLDGAIRHAPGVGGGHGPLNHFWRGILS